jgi:peptide/nickel transport system permease protein
MAISVIVGIPVGVLAALRQDSWADYLTRGGVILFLALPVFWTAILALQVGRIYFQWAPPARYEDLWVDPVQNLYIMATPALILGINLAAIQARFARAQMLEVLRQDYIRTARAKGLTGRAVIVRHALRNALIPVITVIGLQLAGAVTGTIILEQIFLIPGVGRYLIFAATNADYPIVQSVTLLLAVVVVLVNLLIDVSYAFLDPRVRESYA